MGLPVLDIQIYTLVVILIAEATYNNNNQKLCSQLKLISFCAFLEDKLLLIAEINSNVHA